MTAPAVNEVVYALMNAWMSGYISRDAFETKMKAAGFSYPYIDGCIQSVLCLVERQKRKPKR